MWRLRLDDNRGKNPVTIHNGRNPDPFDPIDTVDVQGIPVNRVG